MRIYFSVLLILSIPTLCTFIIFSVSRCISRLLVTPPLPFFFSYTHSDFFQISKLLLVVVRLTPSHVYSSFCTVPIVAVSPLTVLVPSGRLRSPEGRRPHTTGSGSRHVRVVCPHLSCAQDLRPCPLCSPSSLCRRPY